MRTNAAKKRSINYYVLCFLFGPAFNQQDEVLLIRKKRPRWMRGKLNGVGGKVETPETAQDALSRIVSKETGLDITGHTMGEPFTTLHFSNTRNIVFCYTSNRKYTRSAQTMTDEAVAHYGYPQCLQRKDLADHLRWLLPLAVEVNSTVLRHPFSMTID